jgi:hypothetical protein
VRSDHRPLGFNGPAMVTLVEKADRLAVSRRVNTGLGSCIVIVCLPALLTFVWSSEARSDVLALSPIPPSSLAGYPKIGLL